MSSYSERLQIPQILDMLKQVQSIGGLNLQPAGLNGSAPNILTQVHAPDR